MRVQDHVAQSDVGLAALAGLDQLNDASDSLWTRTEVHEPFLVPDGIQSLDRHFGEGRGEIGATERAEAVFGVEPT